MFRCVPGGVAGGPPILPSTVTQTRGARLAAAALRLIARVLIPYVIRARLMVSSVVVCSRGCPSLHTGHTADHTFVTMMAKAQIRKPAPEFEAEALVNGVCALPSLPG